jgi:hypothetical protein
MAAGNIHRNDGSVDSGVSAVLHPCWPVAATPCRLASYILSPNCCTVYLGKKTDRNTMIVMVIIYYSLL